MVLSFETARGRVIVGLVSLVMLMLPAPLMAAGAFAMGKCGAYGQAYDYQSEAAARAAALRKCRGRCSTIVMKRACAAFSIDMADPCGPHGYAVRPHISSALNAATRECYQYGGKQCVIRAWACDGRG